MPLTLSQALKFQRIKRNLTQLKVSEGTGIKNSRLSDYERGIRIPSIWTLTTLADFYDISLDELIDRKRGAK